MYVVSSFISVYGFKIHHVTHHLIFLGNSVATMHVARSASDIERLTDIVALYNTDHFRRVPPFVEQAANPQRCLQAKRDLCRHVGQFQLI